VISLHSGSVRVRIHPADGGRLGSVTVAGHELLVTSDAEALRWGSYPMVPFAGRTRAGRFSFGGVEYQLPLNMAPHAIHGMGWDRPWEVTQSTRTQCVLSIELDERWPLGGRVLQRFFVTDDTIRCEIEVHADQPMPVVVGWHPWFRRPCGYSFNADGIYPRADDHVVTGEITQLPRHGTFDDCFCDLVGPQTVSWPDGPEITITSSCDHLVVYDEPANAVCIEPQSGPPNALNLGAAVVEPGSPLLHWMVWTLGS
jgi:aldose 1-epimerase